jgi:hypothetical protein
MKNFKIFDEALAAEDVFSLYSTDCQGGEDINYIVLSITGTKYYRNEKLDSTNPFQGTPLKYYAWSLNTSTSTIEDGTIFTGESNPTLASVVYEIPLAATMVGQAIGFVYSYGTEK